MPSTCMHTPAGPAHSPDLLLTGHKGWVANAELAGLQVTDLQLTPISKKKSTRNSPQVQLGLKERRHAEMWPAQLRSPQCAPHPSPAALHEAQPCPQPLPALNAGPGQHSATNTVDSVTIRLAFRPHIHLLLPRTSCPHSLALQNSPCLATFVPKSHNPPNFTPFLTKKNSPIAHCQPFVDPIPIGC